MSNSVNYGGPGIVTLLTAIFAVAKLWGVYDMSWWWVFSPVWISMLIALAIYFIVVLIAVIAVLIAVIAGLLE